VALLRGCPLVSLAVRRPLEKTDLLDKFVNHVERNYFEASRKDGSGGGAVLRMQNVSVANY